MRKILFGIVLAVGMLAVAPEAKACDDFFPGQAVAFSNGNTFFQQSGFGFRQSSRFFTPSFDLRARGFVPQQTVIINQRRGLFGLRNRTTVIQSNGRAFFFR